MEIIKRMFALFLFLVLASGCAARSKTVIGDMVSKFDKVKSTNLTVLIRTMGVPRAEDQAIISLAEVGGDLKLFTQVLCHNPDSNLEVLLTPSLTNVYGEEKDGKDLSTPHYEYLKGHYHLTCITHERPIGKR